MDAAFCAGAGKGVHLSYMTLLRQGCGGQAEPPQTQINETLKTTTKI